MGQTTTAVSQHLANGAVGVGENHEDQKARSVVLKVIAQGLVTNLFIELFQGTYGATIQAAQNQIHQGAQGAQLMLGTVDSGASSRGHAPNAIPLSRVILAAIVQGDVAIHCADGRFGNHQNGGTPARMMGRNQECGNIFAQVTNAQDALHANARGSLILFVGAHFENAGSANHPIQHYIPNLPVVMCG